MKTIINEANKDKLTAAIKEAEGRASVRCITAEDIIMAADKITKRLGVTKKNLIGSVALVDINAQDFPNAYRYTPESTQFRMEYTASGWAVTEIMRARTHAAGHAATITLTDAAQQEIIRNASRMSSCEL